MSLADLDYREERAERQSTTTPLKDGFIGKFIITKVTYPYNYLQQLARLNEEGKKEAEYLEEEFIEKKPNRLFGGIAVRCALIEYMDPANYNVWNKTWSKSSDGRYIINDRFNIFTEVDMLPVNKIFYAETQSGYRFGDTYRLGGDDTFGKDGMPKTYNMFPSVKTVEELVKYKPDISDDELKKIKDDFKKRATEWGMLEKVWSELSESDADKFLRNRLARRLMLWDKENKGKKVKYLDPQPGIVFRAKIRKQEDSNYFRLVVLEWSKDSGKWRVENYGEIIANGKTDDLKDLARDLSLSDYSNK